MSLTKDLLEHPGDLPVPSKYTAMNGLFYLGSRCNTDHFQRCVVHRKRGCTYSYIGYDRGRHRMVVLVREPLGRQTDRRRQRIGQSGARSLGARTLGHRGSLSPFSAGVCAPRSDARHWRLAASQSIGWPSTSLDQRDAITVALGFVARCSYKVQ